MNKEKCKHIVLIKISHWWWNFKCKECGKKFKWLPNGKFFRWDWIDGDKWEDGI